MAKSSKSCMPYLWVHVNIMSSLILHRANLLGTILNVVKKDTEFKMNILIFVMAQHCTQLYNVFCVPFTDVILFFGSYTKVQGG